MRNDLDYNNRADFPQRALRFLFAEKSKGAMDFPDRNGATKKQHP
jgi:hypothetical protein